MAGVPGWGAVVIAVIGTFIGLAIEAGAGHHELGSVFAICFATGCIAAVLAVRRSGIFTAVVQPPLLLFVAVPLAYYLFHGSGFNGLKDGLISCGYPLIERFPLMVFTSAVVLVIGLIRHHLGDATPAASASPRSSGRARQGLFAGLAARASSLKSGSSDPDEGTGRPPRPRHTGRSATRQPRPERSPRQTPPPRSRQGRPALDDDLRAAPPRPRRQPVGRPDRDVDAPGLDGQRRRPRPTRDVGSRTPQPPRREPRQRPDGYLPREPREPRVPRSPRPAPASRFEPNESYPPRQPYGPREAYPAAPPRRPEPEFRNTSDRSTSGTHHPVSRVRYRDPSPDDRRGPDRERSR